MINPCAIPKIDGTVIEKHGVRIDPIVKLPFLVFVVDQDAVVRRGGNGNGEPVSLAWERRGNAEGGAFIPRLVR